MASREMARSRRLAHKAPVMPAVVRAKCLALKHNTMTPQDLNPDLPIRSPKHWVTSPLVPLAG